jgi:hypothetical protein
MRVRGLVLAVALFASAGAMAAAESEEGVRPAAARQKRTVLHFGEDDIRGGITRPDGELVQAPRKAHEDSLLRVRRSFADRALSAPLAGR